MEGYVLDKIRCFALFSRKWYYLILKRQKIANEHVAIGLIFWGIFTLWERNCD